MDNNNFLKELKQQQRLFREEKEEIARSNAFTLFRCCALAVILFCSITIFTPFLIPGWVLTGSYYSLIGVFTIFFFVSYYLNKKENISYFVTQFVCVLFYILTILILGIVDTIPYPNGASTFFPLIILILPVIFIFKYQVYVIANICLEIVYVYLDVTYKTSPVWRTDVFTSIVAVAFSFAAAWITLCLRTKDKDEKSSLKVLSSIDQLTGILNKKSSERKIEEALEIRESDSCCALFVLDVDNFKSVNDTYGHQIGDVALLRFAQLLQDTFRISDIIGRIGGDEFVVFIRNVRDIKLVEKKCKMIRRKIHDMEITEDLMLTCSMGVAIAEDEEITYKDLFSLADEALYETKSFAKDGYRIRKSPNSARIITHRYMLIADDTEINREVIKSSFEDQFEYLEAQDGKEVLDYLSAYRKEIAIVMLDLMMPKMNGYEVLSYMNKRQQFKSIPVIVITGDKRSEEKELRLGAEDMILKPIDSAVLKIRVKNALKRNEK